LAICDYLDFNSLDKDFFLFDTFNGIPEGQMAERERDERIKENQYMYEDCYNIARHNFAPFPKAQLIRGGCPIPLIGSVSIKHVICRLI
jgi:hypothetical protein